MPDKRTAKWIDSHYYRDLGIQYAHCSFCGFEIDLNYEGGYLYRCPGCKSKMTHQLTEENTFMEVKKDGYQKI